MQQQGGDAQVVLRDVLAAELALKVSQAKAYAAMSFVTPTSQLEGRFSTPFGPPAVGGDVRIVEAPRENLKVTTPHDLRVAALLLHDREA